MPQESDDVSAAGVLERRMTMMATVGTLAAAGGGDLLPPSSALFLLGLAFSFRHCV